MGPYADSPARSLRPDAPSAAPGAPGATLERLMAQIEGVEKAVYGLGDRLTPILCPEGPEPLRDAPELITSALVGAANRLAMVERSINRIMGRLEL